MPTFEVASVKPMDAGAVVRNPVDIQPGGRLIFRSTVKGLIGTAYQRRSSDSREVIGGPDWVDSQRFEIITKAEGELVDASGFPAPVFDPTSRAPARLAPAGQIARRRGDDGGFSEPATVFSAGRDPDDIAPRKSVETAACSRHQ